MIQTKATVSTGYHCPLCPDHTDADFFLTSVMERPLCEGCVVEYGFAAEDGNISVGDRQAIESASGKSWSECRVLLLTDIRDWWHAAALNQPVEYLESMQRNFGWPAEEVWRNAKEQLRLAEELLTAARAESTAG